MKKKPMALAAFIIMITVAIALTQSGQHGQLSTFFGNG